MSITTRRVAVAASLALAIGSAWAAQPYGFGTTPSEAELSQFVSPLPDGRGRPADAG